MVRMPCCDKAGVKKGPWSQAEDLKLISFIQQHGHDNWRALPKLAGLARCGKSCRLRWINYLRPDLKRGNFTLEEEESIIRLHEQLGNKWSKIASHLPGRTDNEIKNVWNTHLKKRSIARGSKNHPPAKPNDSFTTSTSPTSGKKVLNDTIEFSSSSSTSCQMGKPDCCDDNGIVANVNKQDLLGEVIEIPFEPNLDVWEWLDFDSNCAEGYVLSSEAAAQQQRASDDDSSKGDNGRSWWFEYLENELGLGATTPDAYPDDMTDSALQKFLNEEELLSDPIRSFADMSTFT
ncbi:hypothetical protein Nepgr_002190 [Nepenthes gracilis]|uniref:Uncharacterized protein n=1 Tax=Nepenthes gracilis TaxID=150966 RepID=A0AAD3RY48_NEPGR|nr:hypothetical protein Nepgr_002190 [Nepenthes gracilis]